MDIKEIYPEQKKNQHLTTYLVIAVHLLVLFQVVVTVYLIVSYVSCYLNLAKREGSFRFLTFCLKNKAIFKVIL